MLGARSRLVRGVLAQLSQLFGATVLCHGVLQRKSLVRDLFRLVSYRPLAGKPLIRLDLLHRCWPGHIAEDVPLAIAEAVLAAMGRRRAQGARRRPRPSPAATAIDVFYQYRYIGSRGRGGRSRGGVHEGAPLRRRPPKRLWPAPGGQPFSQARCRAMAFAHQRRQLAGRRAAFRTGRRPRTGATQVRCPNSSYQAMQILVLSKFFLF